MAKKNNHFSLCVLSLLMSVCVSGQAATGDSSIDASAIKMKTFAHQTAITQQGRLDTVTSPVVVTTEKSAITGRTDVTVIASKKQCNVKIEPQVIDPKSKKPISVLGDVVSVCK